MEQTKKDKFNLLKKMLLMILSIIIFILFLFTEIEKISILFLIEASLLMGFFAYIVFDTKDRFNPFSFFLLSLFLGFLDIVLVVMDIRIVTVKYDMDIYEKSLLFIIVWLISFCIGYVFKVKREKKIRIREIKFLSDAINMVNMDMMLIIGVLFQFFISYKIFSTIIAVGGISTAMNDFAVFRYNNQGYLATILPLTSIVTIVLLEKKGKMTSFMSMIYNFILVTLTGRRGLAINTVIIPLLIYYNYRKKKITNKEVIIVCIPIIIFILLIGSIRNQTVKLSDNNAGILNVIARVTNTIQYGQNVPDLINKMDNGGLEFQGLRNLFNGITGLIPRSIWANKPESDHSLITSRLVYYEDITYGKPVGAFGFAYLNLGYIGIVLSGLICGKITNYFYSWVIENKSGMAILLYSILIQSVIIITNPESQLKIITLFGVITVLCIIANAKRRKKDIHEKN